MSNRLSITIKHQWDHLLDKSPIVRPMDSKQFSLCTLYKSKILFTSCTPQLSFKAFEVNEKERKKNVSAFWLYGGVEKHQQQHLFFSFYCLLFYTQTKCNLTENNI